MIKIRMLALVFLSAIVFSASAANTTKTNQWIGASGGDWGVGTNWSLNHTPATDELAYFNFSGQSVEIQVNAEYSIGAFYVDKAAKSAPLTLKGSGSIVAGKYGPSPYIQGNHPFTLDGVTLDVGNYESLWYSPVVLKNGGTFITKMQAYLWNTSSSLTVEDGHFQGGNLYWNANSSVTLNGGSISCAGFKVRNQAAHALALSIKDGTMSVSGEVGLSAASMLNLTGGKLSFGSNLTEKRFLSETKGTAIEVQQQLDLQFTPEEKLTVNGDLTVCNGILVTNAANVTLAVTDGHVLQTKNVSQSYAGANTTIDTRTLVLKDGQPFIFVTAGEAGQEGRIHHLQGPVTIRPTADMSKAISKTVYPYFHGDVVIDTRDWNDSSVVRNMAFRGLGAKDGAKLTLRGGGSVWIMPIYSGESFAKVSVESGTTLTLSDVAGGVDFGPLNTDTFVLGPNAVLNIPAGSNCVQAAKWQIDPTATINVNVSAGMTANAIKILNDLSGQLSSAGQVNIVGDGAAGWTKRFVLGELAITKADGTVDPTYAWNWTGLGADNNIYTAANWSGEVAPVSDNPSGTIFKFGVGGNTRSTVYQSKSITLYGLFIEDSASEPFHFTGTSYYTLKNGTSASLSSSSVGSLSALPTVFACGIRRGGNLTLTAADGPLVFTNSTVNAFYHDKAAEGQLMCSGDIRLGGSQMRYPQLGLCLLESAYRKYRTITPTLVTILSGGSMTLTNQTARLNPDNQATGSIRVNQGGTLTFNGGADASYWWYQSPSRIVVDGTLHINIPFKGGASQSYGGAGVISLSSALPSAAQTCVTFGDSLTVSVGGEWTTVRSGADFPLTWRTVASPTIKLSADWTYGPAEGAEPTSTATDRALVIERSSVLTVNGEGHSATFADPVTGEGTLAVTNGTVKLAGGAAELNALRLENAGILEAEDGLSLGSLEVVGGKIRFATLDPVELSEEVDVGGLAFEFPNGCPDHWTTLLTAPTIRGTPAASDDYKTRIVAINEGSALQCRRLSGAVLIFR